MTLVQDLTAAVTKLEGDVDTLSTNVTNLVTAVNTETAAQAVEIQSLKDQITALLNANPTVDVAALLVSLGNLDASVTRVSEAALAATPVPAP